MRAGMTVESCAQVSTPLACLLRLLIVCWAWCWNGACWHPSCLAYIELLQCMSPRHESMRREFTSRAQPTDTKENIEPSTIQVSLSPTHKSTTTTSCFEKDIRANGCARSIDRWIVVLQAATQLVVARKNHSRIYVCVCSELSTSAHPIGLHSLPLITQHILLRVHMERKNMCGWMIALGC